ncbi:hypothetical protein BO78DRAFT_223425 [Aspergillus sclerotiicarbonarius CBS 121057]|uniref:Uncharacterized protein n=1 Tax=Aspergillus sclerotiicarbonarius (strain CBS 121057 / IBT 28362) TaxID=1448318 RepID=A0A319DX82_ASPSB|nr:hypothetical protein BO78DRAFT_223425 [Aspergillus sclerotiicarbonarius CBS 121057]
MLNLYFCCQCGDGPKLIQNQPQCVVCRHIACSSCKPAGGGKDRPTPHHEKASPTVATTSNWDSGSSPTYALESCAAFHDIRESMDDASGRTTPIECHLNLDWDLRKFVEFELNGC